MTGPPSSVTPSDGRSFGRSTRPRSGASSRRSTRPAGAPRHAGGTPPSPLACALELDAEPTAAFLRLGERLARAPAPPADRRIGSAALFTPDLVGRDGALGVLRAAWSEVRSGARVIVLVAGDPGIGKTRLCDQFLLEPSVSAGTAILRVQPARATAPAGGTVLRQLLAPLVLMPGVGAARPQALAEVAAAVPEFRERFPDLPPATGRDEALGEGLAEVLSAVADERPLILFLDDFGALDPAAQSMVTYALGHPGAPLLAIVTTGSEGAEGSPGLAGLRTLPELRRLTLPPLEVPQVEAMLQTMLALGADDRHRLATRLHAVGGGNPSYTVEMVSALVDDGSLSAAPSGTWHLAELEAGHLPLPRSLREAVGRRLAQLDPGSLAVLDAAAVLGPVFRPELLAAVAGLALSAAEPALGELLTRRVIRRVPGTADTFEFAQELIARVAYERVPPESRHQLHRAAARAWRAQADAPGPRPLPPTIWSAPRPADTRRAGPGGHGPVSPPLSRPLPPHSAGCGRSGPSGAPRSPLSSRVQPRRW